MVPFIWSIFMLNLVRNFNERPEETVPLGESPTQPWIYLTEIYCNNFQYNEFTTSYLVINRSKVSKKECRIVSHFPYRKNSLSFISCCCYFRPENNKNMMHKFGTKPASKLLLLIAPPLLTKIYGFPFLFHKS